MPVEDTDKPLHQGPLEYPELHLFTHVQPFLLLVCPVRRRCVVWDRQGAVCWIPLPLFWGVVRAQWVCVVSCFLSIGDPFSGSSRPACYNLMFIFGTSSFAAAVNTFPGGVFQRRRHLTALPELHLIQYSAKFRHKTLQHQLHLALRFHSRTYSNSSRAKIIIWQDLINNSLSPHPSNFIYPLSPTALIQELRALPCDIAAIVYCQRTGSPDVFQLLRQSFLVISLVRDLLSHHKQHNFAPIRQYSVFHLAVHLELQFFFLPSQHLHHLRTFNYKESRLNKRRRRSLHRRAPWLSNSSPRNSHFFPLALPPTLFTLPTPLSSQQRCFLSSFFYCLGLVLSLPGFSFLDTFSGGFRGVAWVVLEPYLL